MVAGAVLLVVGQGAFRVVEAWFSAGFINAVRLAPTEQAGTSVFFPAKTLLIDFDITTACTAALLISPFCLLAAGLLVSGRMSVRRSLGTLAGTALAIFAVNQVRFLVIALSLRLWGYPKGYEVSHIFIGTIVSTLGILGGLVVFVLSAKRARRPSAALLG